MLRALLLKKKIDDKKKQLEELRAKDEEFTKREADLTASIDEAQTDEERSAVEEAVGTFEEEKKAHDEAKALLENEVRDLEGELKDIEAQDAEQARATEAQNNEREGTNMDETRSINNTERKHGFDAIMQREDVKAWLGEIRSHIKEKRALTNVGLTIPEVFLGLLRENLERYSKLYRHVTVRPVNGTARQVIMGSVPEGVWTECCANLNELSLVFNDAEVDCYKVGGYFKVCNAVLEDSDVQLASQLLEAIGQAIGLALDKAILYGRNSETTQKMPEGIMSRLVQTSKPAGYPATAREWEDLHTKNIRTIGSSALPVSGIDLYKDIVKESAAMKGKYARGRKTWVMNETTYTNLVAEAMSVNAAGGIVSGLSDTMPVLGGDVEVLDFIPDGVIIGGYFELYLLAERAGTQFAQSEHAFFINDQTVFKGTARYDGLPVIAEAFMAIGINGPTPNASMTFASDTANAGA
ncbi:MAG: phage major capsid protein [Spirochaetales bacterium]|nr:phage major capsid protein [Spirochaetales bacterium]